MLLGIGYQEYKKNRAKTEGINANHLENVGNEKYILYFARSYMIDYQTNILARGPLKVGRGKFATALMRGRNQPGIDFRIYAEIVLCSNKATHVIENIFKKQYIKSKKVMSQNQQECYDIENNEIPNIIKYLSDWISLQSTYKILEINTYI